MRSMMSESTASRTHGRAAAAHEKLSMLAVDSIGPEAANAIEPSAAAEAPTRRLRNRYIPTAAIGTGSATARLKPTTSEGTNLSNANTGCRMWRTGSDSAVWPKPTHGSHIGNSPFINELRSQRCSGQK